MYSFDGISLRMFLRGIPGSPGERAYASPV
jgi:hypothetical protein